MKPRKTPRIVKRRGRPRKDQEISPAEITQAIVTSIMAGMLDRGMLDQRYETMDVKLLRLGQGDDEKNQPQVQANLMQQITMTAMQIGKCLEMIRDSVTTLGGSWPGPERLPEPGAETESAMHRHLDGLKSLECTAADIVNRLRLLA